MGIGGRSFQGKRAVFGDEESADGKEVTSAEASELPKRKKLRSHKQDVVNPLIKTEAEKKLPVKKSKVKKKSKSPAGERKEVKKAGKQKKQLPAVRSSSVEHP